MSIMEVNSALAGAYPYTDKVRKPDESKADFLEQLQKKEEAAQDKAMDQAEKAFAMVGQNAPQAVKNAWMEAAEEVRANGLGTRKNGMMSHISQMMVQRLNKMIRGDGNYNDILGNSVGSAIRATKEVLYDLDHPVSYQPKSVEVQQARMKERAFYIAFLEKLEKFG